MSIFIDDGYTLSKEIEAVPGIHPAMSVEYRPALAVKRAELGVVAGRGDAAKITEFENELLAKHIVRYDAGDIGGELKKADAGRMIPTLRNKLISLVLGYEPADEEADLGNSPSA